MLALVVVLTVLAAVVVVLTRLRLRGSGAAGRHDVGTGVLGVHTPLGVAALVVWTTFLVAPADSALGASVVGILGLALWWVEVVVGLLILTRWLPSKGRHAGEGTTDGWTSGPWLSVLAHVGLLGGVLVFTYAYLTSAV